MTQYRIGDVAEKLEIPIDTLRYYERIGLLPKVSRNGSGIRLYNDQDLSSVRFIQRAQQMNFSLKEITELLRMREAPQKARKGVRELTVHKLAEIEDRLKELKTLRDELQLLVNLCSGSKEGCAIIQEIDSAKTVRPKHFKKMI